MSTNGLAKLKPLGRMILVNPDPVAPYHEFKQYQHIVVPDAFAHGPEDRPVWGRILARGPLCVSETVVGDQIVFGKWAGARIRQGTETVMLVHEADVLAVVDA